MLKTIIFNHHLILMLTSREILTKYKGSVLGVLWPIINPILMLSIYTLIFSQIFNIRWNVDNEVNTFNFAINLYIGMIIVSFFNDVLTKSPSLFLNNVNYVKKVIFPLEILPLVAVLSSLFQAFLNSIVLFVFIALTTGDSVMNNLLNFIYFSTLLIILSIFSLGISWILSSVGVFFKDLNHAMGILANLLMFLTPVFYPLSAVPEKLKIVLNFNPLTFFVDESRSVLFLSNNPNAPLVIVFILISISVLYYGYYILNSTKSNFSDVI